MKRYTIYADTPGLLGDDGKIIEVDGVKVYLASEVDARDAAMREMEFSADKKPTKPGLFWALGTAAEDGVTCTPYTTIVLENKFGLCVPFRMDGGRMGISIPIDAMQRTLWGDEIIVPLVRAPVEKGGE